MKRQLHHFADGRGGGDARDRLKIHGSGSALVQLKQRPVDRGGHAVDAGISARYLGDALTVPGTADHLPAALDLGPIGNSMISWSSMSGITSSR